MLNLVYERKFIDQAADTLVEQFNDTIEFAKLRSLDKIAPVADGGDDPKKEDEFESSSREGSSHDGHQTHSTKKHSTPRQNVLATFKVPFALSEAEITFTGQKIDPEDFDALTDYVAIFKKQYQRKLAAQNAQATEEREARIQADLNAL